MRRLLPALLAAGVTATAPAPVVLAHHAEVPVRAGDLSIGHGWTVENAGTAHAGAVYLTVANAGTAPDRLTGASVPFADRVTIQAPVLGPDGTLAVRDLRAVAVAPGQSLTFQPGGVRLVLEGLHARFRAGEHFAMTLTFERAGAVDVEIEVEPRSEADGTS